RREQFADGCAGHGGGAGGVFARHDAKRMMSRGVFSDAPWLCHRFAFAAPLLDHVRRTNEHQYKTLLSRILSQFCACLSELCRDYIDILSALCYDRSKPILGGLYALSQSV